MNKKVRVRINGKSYEISTTKMLSDHGEPDLGQAKLLAVTENPKTKDSVIVWRRVKNADGYEMTFGYEARLSGGKIEEKPLLFSEIYDELVGCKVTIPVKGKEFVSHFEVREDMRKKGIGTALREDSIGEARRRNAVVSFPRTDGHPEKFYRPRGFHETVDPMAPDDHSHRYSAKPEDLDFSKNRRLRKWGSDLQGFRILWAKSRKYK